MRQLVVACSVVAFAVLFTPAPADAACSICQQCQSDSDCGSGETCYNFGGNVGFVCTQQGCQPGGCPGDSVCYDLTVDGNNIGNFCLNPDANTAWCNPTYACQDDGQACSGLGTDCSGGASACSAVGSALCVSDSTSSWCSCYCESDADCGSGNTCITLSDGSGACMPGGGGSNNNGGGDGLCAGITCGVGQVCDPGTGKCVDENGDLCAGMTCPNGGVCSPATGTCIGGDGEPEPEPTGEDTMATADMGSGTSEADMSSSADMSSPDAGLGSADSLGGADAGSMADVSANSGRPPKDGFDHGGCNVARRSEGRAPLTTLLLLAGLFVWARRRG